MIKKILFPKRVSVKSNEYNHHYLFIKKYAELVGIEVEIINPTDKVWCSNPFSILIDGKQVLIDYSDHPQIHRRYNTDIPYFKYHFTEGVHEKQINMVPIGPMLDLKDLDTYRYFFDFIKQDIYNPSKSDIVLSIQRPHHNALQRRSKVQKMLKDAYGDKAITVEDFVLGDQRRFWSRHKDCLVEVAVPGARNDLEDRGAFESLAMGICIIHPHITTILPYHKKLINGEHCIECKPDYSDLIEKIEWCKQNRNECKRIGNNAKKLFQDYCKPSSYWQWIKQNL